MTSTAWLLSWPMSWSFGCSVFHGGFISMLYFRLWVYAKYFILRHVQFFWTVKYLAEYNIQSRHIILVTPCVQIPRFAVEIAPHTLRSSWKDAVFSKSTLHPRQHQLLMHLLRVINNKMVCVYHVLKKITILFGFKVIKHFGMS